MLIVVLLVIVAALTGVLGFVIKGALWLLLIALIVLAVAALMGRTALNKRR